MNIVKIIVGISTVIGFVAAYILHLKGVIETHENTIAKMSEAQQQKEWQDKLAADAAKVKETERDYDQSSDDFRNKYGNGGSSGSQPPPSKL